MDPYRTFMELVAVSMVAAVITVVTRLFFIEKSVWFKVIAIYAAITVSGVGLLMFFVAFIRSFAP